MQAATPPPKDVKLKVAEAIQDDVNKGIVRIDSSYMRQIDIRPGNIVEISGGRTTVGIADRSLPGDIGLNIIRTDPLIRRNAKTSIGELVTVKKAEIKEARKVIIAPARKGVMIRANPVIFKQGLLGRAVVKGDVVALGGSRRRRTAMTENPFFEDMFSMLDDTMMGFGLGDLKFIVADCQPKQSVLITENTEIVFNPNAIEIREDKVIDITYEDIGGLDDELKKVREMVELPLKHPEIFERLGIDPPKGVLLHGPPGTGKTLLAKAVANETNSNFILINGPEIMSKYYGQSEENLRKKFEEAEKNAPSIIFIDEIDAIASKREESRGEVERRVVAQLLAIMDGLKSRGKVVVIAATNIPNSLDPALRRPGRFDREIEIGVPSKEGRLNILKIHTRNMPVRPPFEFGVARMTLEKLRTSLKKVDAQTHTEKIARIDSLLTRMADASAKGLETHVTISDRATLDKVSDLIIKYLASISAKDKESEDLTPLFKIIKSFDDLYDAYYGHTDLDDDRRLLLHNFLEEQNFLRLVEERELTIQTLEYIIPRIKDDKIQSQLRKVVGLSSTADELEEELWAQLRTIDDDIYAKMYGKAKDKMFRILADRTHGFVGADLAALSKESAMIVLRNIMPDLRKQEARKEKEGLVDAITPEIEEKLVITERHFKDALKVLSPSALREVLIEVPNVHWSDIGGLADVKQELIEAVEWPLRHKGSFSRLGVKPPKGVLLYGPPGTGKTMLAKAVSNESEANFILIKGPELLSKWVGESEKAVRKIFEKARQSSPTIIFFDEIDSLAPRRGASSDSHVTERVVNQLLTEIDGLQELNDIVIIGATNRPDIVDTALLRPGRFDRIIYVPVPDQLTRYNIFKVHSKGIPINYDSLPKNYAPKIVVSKTTSDQAITEQETKVPELRDKQEKFLWYLAEKTDGYVGADIESICREAAILTLRKNMKSKEVSLEFFEAAIKKVAPSTTKEMEANYKNLQRQFRAAKGKELEKEKPSYYG